MFEEDVPSVLELEMEELDQWMKKEGRFLKTHKSFTQLFKNTQAWTGLK